MANQNSRRLYQREWKRKHYKKVEVDRRFKAESILGRIFGKLTVLERISNDRNGARWLCKCECGKSTELPTQRVKRAQSCGCLKRNPEAAFTLLLRTYIGQAHKRKLAWELTEEQFRNITSAPCHYTGRAPSMCVKTVYDVYFYNGVDRMDNTKGYTLENCVPCCSEANYAKRALSYAGFMKLCEDIVQCQKKTKN